jgi:hypothetical protein
MPLRPDIHDDIAIILVSFHPCWSETLDEQGFYYDRAEFF